MGAQVRSGITVGTATLQMTEHEDEICARIASYWIVRRERINDMAKDLVCGMEVDPKTAAATSEYKEETYYFCAPGCKAAFDRDPERYLETAEETGEHTPVHMSH